MVNAPVLTAVMAMSRLPSWGSSPSKSRLCQQHIARLSCRLCQAVTNIGAGYQSGKHHGPFLDGSEAPVLQPGLVQLPGSASPALLWGIYRLPGLRPIRAVLQQERNTRQGFALQVYFSGGDGSQLLPVGDAVKSIRLDLIGFPFGDFHSVNPVAQIIPLGAWVSPDGVCSKGQPSSRYTPVPFPSSSKPPASQLRYRLLL